MKNLAFAFVSIIVCTFLSSCRPEPSANPIFGSWRKLSDFEGDPRGGAVAFVINSKAYVGGGFNSTSNSLLNDFWRYDAEKSLWEQVAKFPGTPRQNAVAFELHGKGYVGTGIGTGYIALSDFYEFDPDIIDSANGVVGAWKKIADFPDKRFGAIAFSVNDRAFVGTGTNERGGSFSDLWEYIPVNNLWIKKPSIIGSKRAYSFVMKIEDYVYVGGGIDNGGIIPDLSRFDVSAVDNGQPWSPMNGLTGKDANGNTITQPKPRALATAFAINNHGYLTCGSYASTSQISSDLWQYDPSTDSWLQCFSFASNTPYVGAARNSAVAFSIGTAAGTFGYLTTGSSGSLPLDDLWMFDPKGVEPDNK